MNQESGILMRSSERWHMKTKTLCAAHIIAALNDVREEWGAYFELVMQNMPMNTPDGFHWNVPATDRLDAIETASNKFTDRLGTVTA
jgi:hypothetical protein